MYRKSIFQEARELNEMISNACGDENVLRLAYKRRGSDHPVTWADTPDFAKLLSRILRRLELAEKFVGKTGDEALGYLLREGEANAGKTE